LCLGLATSAPGSAPAPAPSAAASQKGTIMNSRARGPFDVKTTPPSDDKGEGGALGRMSIDKQYHGDLEGTGKGEMLTAGSGLKGSGAYVAVERVSGTLQGRKGTFLLQHRGIMTRGAPELAIAVVPDSGTGELAGISGRMGIVIAPDGKHSYDFEYSITPLP
jgi:hypothetical protein